MTTDNDASLTKRACIEAIVQNDGNLCAASRAYGQWGHGNFRRCMRLRFAIERIRVRDVLIIEDRRARVEVRCARA